MVLYYVSKFSVLSNCMAVVSIRQSISSTSKGDSSGHMPGLLFACL